MKKYLHGTVSFFRRPRNLIIALLVIAIALFFVFSGKKATISDLITVKRGSITQDVVVTGDITSSENVDLSFEQPGKVSKAYVATGDNVNEGDILMTQDSNVLQAQLSQAKAQVAAAEANLAILVSGATPEEIGVYQAQVQSAESSLSDAEKSVVSTINDAYTKADDAVHNQADQIFTNPRTNPQFIYPIGNQQLAINVQAERLNVEKDFGSWSSAVSGLTTGSDLLSAIKGTKGYLNDIQNFLTDVASAVNSMSPSGGLTQATIDNWKAAVSTGRTEVGTAITNVVAAETGLNSAEAALTVARKQLTLKQAPATSDEVAAQVAQVNQSKSQVDLIQAQINQTILRSPVAGVVTDVVPKVGEVTSAGETVVSVMGNNSLEVEAYVAESDVAKLKIGDGVSMTFDAFPSENFSGHVISINPAQTIINGVANYKIKVDFDKMDPRFKSGLTANLTIETQRKDNVLVIPQFAIIQNDQGTFVTKVTNGKDEQVPVTLGIQDQNGNAEVLSGLQEGDQILNVGLNP